MLNRGTQEKALILGTGGASKAILYTLQKLGIECTYVSRSVREGQLTYSDLNKEIIDNNLLIINATPLGSFPKTDVCPDIPYQFLTTRHLLVSMLNPPYYFAGKENGLSIILLLIVRFVFWQ